MRLAAVSIRTILIAAITSLALGTPASLAGTTRITLKPSIDRSAADAPRALLLRDVAEIEGELAPSLGELRVGDATAAAASNLPKLTLTLGDIRTALDSAEVNWGRIELNGSACEVALPGKAASVAPRVQGQEAPSRVPQPIDFSGPATIRTAVAMRIASMLNTAPTDIRLYFESGEDEFLNTPTLSKRVDLQPASNAASGRIPMHVTLYEGDRVAASRLVSASVLIRRTVVAATSAVDRGEALDPTKLDVSEQWVSPAVKASVAPEAIEGSVTNVRLQPGQVITASDVAKPVVCKRGEVVYVHALSGSVTIKAKARALAAARDGESVQLKLDGSDRVFTARMSGPGRAVLIVNPDAPESPSTPAQGINVTPLPGEEPGPQPKAAPRPARPTPSKPKIHPLVQRNPR